MASKNGHKRGIIYCRVSTDEQRENTSLDSQEKFCRGYAKKHGFTIVGKPFREDYTGSVPFEQRPEGAKAYAMLASNKADALIVWKMNRLARPREDGDEWGLPLLVRGLAKAGKEIHLTDKGKIETTFIGLMTAVMDGKSSGDAYRDLIDAMYEGRKEKAGRLKKWVGIGPPPYGFDKVGKGPDAELIINAFQAGIVRDIFTWYVIDDLSPHAIAERLNKQGIKPPHIERPTRIRKKSKRVRLPMWSRSGVLRILTNARYIGKFTFGKDIVVDLPHLAIISKQVWHAAEKRRSEKYILKPKSHLYLMSNGRVECVCGHSMGGTGDERGRYYRCSTHSAYLSGDPRRCASSALRADDLDATAYSWIATLATDRERLAQLISDMQTRVDVELQPLKAEHDELSQAEGEIRSRMTTLVRRIGGEKDEHIASTLEAELKNLSAELDRVIRRRERTEAEIRKYGAWADAKAITVDSVQAELSNIGFDVSGIHPASGFDTAVWLNPEYLNLDACRRVITKYDVKAKVLPSGKLRISCVFIPKGEVVRLESMRDNITVQAVSINGVGGASLTAEHSTVVLSETIPLAHGGIVAEFFRQAQLQGV